MKASSVREKIKLSKKYSELSYWRNICSDTKELFLAYDAELADFLNQAAEVINGPSTLEESSIENSKKEDSLIKFKEKNEERIFENCESSEQDTQKEDPVEEVIENKKAPDWMKKAFKSIALKTHPDKVLHRNDISDIEKEELVKKYSEAAKAMSVLSGVSIIEIAQSLNIDLDLNPKQQILMIENKLEKIKKEVEKYQQMISWSWGENEGNLDVRSNLFLHVLNHLKMQPIEISQIKKMIEKFENGDKLVEKINRRDKILNRRVGQRPAPGISRSRKK
jgi:hypothetical protein